MKLVKKLKIINNIGDASAVIGLLVISIYILFYLMNSTNVQTKGFYLKPILSLIMIWFQFLCIIKIIKAIFDYKRNKKWMTRSYINIPVNEMIISAVPKNKAIYTIKGYYFVNGTTYQYFCEIIDDFHLITDYMIKIKEKGSLPSMKVYVDAVNYEQYYISPYEYLEKLLSNN